jgi:hypothetical protein
MHSSTQFVMVPPGMGLCPGHVVGSLLRQKAVSGPSSHRRENRATNHVGIAASGGSRSAGHVHAGNTVAPAADVVAVVALVVVPPLVVPEVDGPLSLDTTVSAQAARTADTSPIATIRRCALMLG